MEGFVVLIGSCARGTQQAWSDVDVLRVQSQSTPDVSKYGTFVSYIDIEKDEFESLFQNGSLFLLHAFTEGVLLQGDSEEWERLRQRFVLTDDHSSLVREYLDVLQSLNSSTVYVDAYVPYLSNTCKAMKNIGIGVLAQKKQFIFEKHLALELGCHLSIQQTRLLMVANNTFERGTPINQDMLQALKAEATNWGENWKDYAKRAVQ